METLTVNAGLDGVVVAETRLSRVDGQRGELVIAGERLDTLVRSTFDEVVERLWSAAGLEARPRTLALPQRTLSLLEHCAAAHLEPMDALRAACATLTAPSDTDAAKTLVGTFPTIVATYWRLLQGRAPIDPRPELSLAENFLYLLTGEPPHPELVRGLDTYLVTVSDHGLNASTFAARVVTSTESDLVSAITAAIGALKGPLHGGAPGPALDMVFAIGDASRAEEDLRRRIVSGEKLMGFGHRVYKVRDPRADVLAAAAERMFTRAGDMSLYTLAREVERVALRLLEEYKPGRRLQTNVEFYTALLLHGLGLEVPLFTPTFAIGRVAGWTAHCLEQRAVGRIMRPQSVYVGTEPGSR